MNKVDRVIQAIGKEAPVLRDLAPEVRVNIANAAMKAMQGTERRLKNIEKKALKLRKAVNLSDKQEKWLIPMADLFEALEDSDV